MKIRAAELIFRKTANRVCGPVGMERAARTCAVEGKIYGAH